MATACSSTGFNGEVHEPLNGWQLLGQGYRTYNPGLMRFHSQDSASPWGAGGLNGYAYGLADPINTIDPSGHSAWQLLGAMLQSARALTRAAPVVTRRLLSAVASSRGSAGSSIGSVIGRAPAVSTRSSASIPATPSLRSRGSAHADAFSQSGASGSSRGTKYDDVRSSVSSSGHTDGDGWRLEARWENPMKRTAAWVDAAAGRNMTRRVLESMPPGESRMLMGTRGRLRVIRGHATRVAAQVRRPFASPPTSADP